MKKYRKIISIITAAAVAIPALGHWIQVLSLDFTLFLLFISDL